jgi:hypothetical protein
MFHLNRTLEYGTILTAKTEELGEKPVPVPLCLPQIPHGLTRARTGPPR